MDRARSSFRQYAMLHVAMFDAVNSVTKQYRPYRLEVATVVTGSEEAAAAQAAHDVMVALFPAASASFDAVLSARLATLPSGAVAQGTDVGKQVATAVLQWRADDGSAGPDPAYLPPPLPGLWRPATPGQVAAGGRMLTMRPFALLTSTQYLPAPPPALDTPEYAENFAQVRDLGRSDSVVRTADQTRFALMIAGSGYRPGPFALWNAVARGLAESRQLSLTDTARLFALLNVDVTRSFAAFSQLADEAGMSRVHGGIHFEFEQHASNGACTKVADYVYDNFMRPR